MTDAFDTRAREIACPYANIIGTRKCGEAKEHIDFCEDLTIAISSALREAHRQGVQEERAAWELAKINQEMVLIPDDQFKPLFAIASAIRGESK